MTSASLLQTLPPFDELVELAQRNPLAFDMLKQDMCEEMILSASANMQDRLWAQQSHIDLVIRQCKNPDHANVKLMQALSEQVHKFQLALLNQSEEEMHTECEVIPFPSALQREKMRIKAD